MEPGAKFGHYVILSAIGRGGMGEVWKARDTDLGREVVSSHFPRSLRRTPIVLLGDRCGWKGAPCRCATNCGGS